MRIIHCRKTEKKRSGRKEIKPSYDPEACNRHILVFGEDAQSIISGLVIGIVGLGGLGMILGELLMRLFPGLIIAADFDRVCRSNLNRLPGATFKDAEEGILKTDLFTRNVRNFNPDQNLLAINGNFLDKEVQEQFKKCDFLFVATDSVSSRIAANHLGLAHGIIVLDVGTGASVSGGRLESAGGQVICLRQDSGFCLTCARIYHTSQMAKDFMSDEELAVQEPLHYVRRANVPAPQVYALNMMTAAWAVWLFQRLAAGEEPKFDGIAVDAKDYMAYVWTERRYTPNPCPICGPGGIIFAGDDVDLLVKDSNSSRNNQGSRDLSGLKPLSEMDTGGDMNEMV